MGSDSSFFGEFNLAAPCGVSLPGLPAELCRAFRLLSAALPCSVPSAHPGRAFRRLVTLRSVWWRGAAGERRVFGDSGRCGLAGRGTPAAWQGSGRGPPEGERVRPAAGDGFGIFSGTSTRLRLAAFLCRASRQIPAALSSAYLLCLTAYPCRAIRRFLVVGSARRRGVAGVLGVFGGFGAFHARGQGNACGVAGEWAGPTAGGWIWDFAGDSIHAVPVGASLPCL